MANPKTQVRNGVLSLSSFSFSSDDGTSATLKKKKTRKITNNNYKIDHVKPKRISIHVRKSGLELFRNKAVEDTIHTPPTHWKQAVSTPHHRLQDFDFPDDVSEIMPANNAEPNINKEQVLVNDGKLLRRSKRRASDGQKTSKMIQSSLKNVEVLQDVVVKYVGNEVKQIDFSTSDSENEVIDTNKRKKKTECNFPEVEASGCLINSEHESVKSRNEKANSVIPMKSKGNISRHKTHFMKNSKGEVDIVPASQEIQFENSRPNKMIGSPVEQSNISVSAKKNTRTQSSQSFSEHQNLKLGKSNRAIKKRKSLYRQPSQVLLVRSKADKSKMDLLLKRVKVLEDNLATLNKTNKSDAKVVQDLSWQAQVNELLVDEQVEEELSKDTRGTEVYQMSMNTLMRDILGTEQPRNKDEPQSLAPDNSKANAKPTLNDEVESIPGRLPLSQLRENAVVLPKQQLKTAIDLHEVKKNDVKLSQLNSTRRVSQRLIFDDDDDDEENVDKRLTNILGSPSRNSLISKVLPPPVNFLDSSGVQKKAAIINNNTPLSGAISRLSRGERKSKDASLLPRRISKRLSKKEAESGLVDALTSAMRKEIKEAEQSAGNVLENCKISQEEPVANKAERIIDAVGLRKVEVHEQNTKLPATLSSQNVLPQKTTFAARTLHVLDDFRQKLRNGVLSQEELIAVKELNEAILLVRENPQNTPNDGGENQVPANDDHLQLQELNEQRRLTASPAFPVVDDMKKKMPIPAPRLLRKPKASPKSTVLVSRKSLKKLDVSKANRKSQLSKDDSISKALNEPRPMQSSDDDDCFDAIEYFNRIERQKIDEELERNTATISTGNEAESGVKEGKQARHLKQKSPEPPSEAPENLNGKIARGTLLQNRSVQNMEDAGNNESQELKDSIERTKTNLDNLAKSDKKSLSRKLHNEERLSKKNSRISKKNQREVQDNIDTSFAPVRQSEEVNNPLVASPIASCSSQVQRQLDNGIDGDYLNNNDNIQLELRQMNEQNVGGNSISKKVASSNSSAPEPPNNVTHKTRGRKKGEKGQVPTNPIPSASKEIRPFKPPHEEKKAKRGRKRKSETIQQPNNTHAWNLKVNSTEDGLYLLNNKNYILQFIPDGNSAPVSRYGRVQKVANRKMHVLYAPSTAKKLLSGLAESQGTKKVKEKKQRQSKAQKKNKEQGPKDVPKVDQQNDGVRTIHSEITEELPGVVSTELKSKKGRRSRKKPVQPVVEPPTVIPNDTPLQASGVSPSVEDQVNEEYEVLEPRDELIQEVNHLDAYPELDKHSQVEMTEPMHKLNREDIEIPTSDARDEILNVLAAEFKAQQATTMTKSNITSAPPKARRRGRPRKVQPPVEEFVPPPLNNAPRQLDLVANETSTQSQAGPSNVLDEPRIIFFGNNNYIKYVENAQSSTVYMGPGYKQLQVCSIRLQPKQKKVPYNFPSAMVCMVLEGRGTLHYRGVDSNLVTNVTKFLVKENTPFTVSNLGAGMLDIFGVQSTDTMISNPASAAEILKTLRL